MTDFFDLCHLSNCEAVTTVTLDNWATAFLEGTCLWSSFVVVVAGKLSLWTVLVAVTTVTIDIGLEIVTE